MKFTYRENEIFYKENNIFIKEENLAKIAKKIARHYKFPFNGIKFRYMKKSAANVDCQTYIITFDKYNKPSLSTLLHELGHIYTSTHYNNNNHNKKLISVMRRFTDYCYKNQSIIKLIKE